MPKAALILHRKRRYDDGAILELKLWQVPTAVPGSKHRFKYSLFYGSDGRRLIGYDNEAGKAAQTAKPFRRDHRHYAGHEEAYAFTSFRQTLADFLADVRQLRGGKL